MTWKLLRSLSTLVLACFFMASYAQPERMNTYTENWKKIEQLMQKGLPADAMKLAQETYELAKNRKDYPELLRTLLYLNTLVENVEEDDDLKNIKRLEKEAAGLPEPARQVAYGLVAHTYDRYFQDERWQIMNRTALSKPDWEHPETWSAAEFQQVITRSFDKSLANRPLLLQTTLDGYGSMVLRGNQPALRPTLFDLLAHAALEHYNNNDRDAIKPAYSFQLNDAACLAPAKTFLRYKYQSPDSTNSVLKSIQLYQHLLEAHLAANRLDAAIDVDIARLTYAYENHIGTEKKRLYREGLELLYQQYPNHPYAMQAGYLLANWWSDEAEDYMPIGVDEAAAQGFQIALRYCDEIISRFPESEGGVNAWNLKVKITKPKLEVITEKVNLPKMPFRGLVTFKALKSSFLRILPINKELKGLLKDDTYDGRNQLWQRLLSIKPEKTWKQTLPDPGDYREHTAEIKIDALPAGEYLLLVSANEAFTLKENELSYTRFYVSQISFVGEGKNHFVLDRETGQPLSGATVKLYTQEYQYDRRRYDRILMHTLTSDIQGHVLVPDKSYLTEKKPSYIAEILWQNDYLFLDNNLQATPVYYRDDDREDYNLNLAEDRHEYEEDQARYWLFTDRSLYRPGQKVHFKAIGVTRDAKTFKSKVFLPQKPIVLLLKDVNRNKVDSLTLQPGAAGSMHGTFKLPVAGLTGNYFIDIEGYRSNGGEFKVEAYKRPKFYVEIAQPTQAYVPGDTVLVTGKAIAYAGNAIDGAKVDYRIYRSTRFYHMWPSWRMGSRWPDRNTDRQEITHGEMVSGSDGAFDLRFSAIPDYNIDPGSLPTFEYTIEVVVTDPNGETHEAEQTVSVGYRSMLLELSGLKDAIQTGSKAAAIFHTTTINGQPLTVPVQVQLHRLRAPEKPLRPRFWKAPDTAVLAKEDWYRLFPNDPYRDDQEPGNWERMTNLGSWSLTDSSSRQSWTLPESLTPGWYLLTATSLDKSGKPVTTEHRFAMYDAEGSAPAGSVSFLPNTTASTQPGKDAAFLFGTTVPELYVVQQVSRTRNDKVNEEPLQYLPVEAGMYRQTFSVNEADRGGFVINRLFVWNNRFYTHSWRVAVPYTNKELKVEWTSFRNKLLPGQPERWQARITGSKGEALGAELLAAMYDKSLDAIYPHEWNLPRWWQNNSYRGQWGNNGQFSSSYAYNHSDRGAMDTTRHFEKSYDQLRLHGFDRIDFDRVLSGRMLGVVMSAPAMEGEGELQEMVIVSKAMTGSITVMTDTAYPPQTEEKGPEEKPIQVRKNMEETAFFFPELRTDAEGKTLLEFTVPEALTTWKVMMLAHTPELAHGYLESEVITQKELMVQPNAPRFLRQGDAMELLVKVVNMSDRESTGTATLELLDAATGKPVDGWFKNVFPNQYFTAPAKGSTVLRFPLEAPMQFEGGLTYRIVARDKEGNGDGEEMVLPVLTNKLLVTESLPMYLNGAGEKTYDFTKLRQSGESPTLQHQSLTVEYTSNPVWYAVQSLPYLIEYPYDCAEQTWNRYYANTLSAFILNSNPKIAGVIKQWKESGSRELTSKLEQNEQLKQLLLQESPWVLAGKSETEQKQQLAALMDAARLEKEGEASLKKLKELQSPNGGFVWFKGGPDDRYMTQYILTGIGHLRRLKAWPTVTAQNILLQQIITNALPYLDERMVEDYERWQRDTKQPKPAIGLHQLAIQYLLTISLFPEHKPSAKAAEVIAVYQKEAVKEWPKLGKYQQGMVALALHRKGDAATAKKITESLRQYSLVNDEMGRYWKEFNTAGYYWWNAPIESHALLLEAMEEIDNRPEEIAQLKTWLLKQKQTQHWRTTKATAEACYALLLGGDNWLNAAPQVTITLGKTILTNANGEAGTGYFQQRLDGEKVTENQGAIQLKVMPEPGSTARIPPSWGAVYWQYFEQLDRITPAATGVKMQKQLFIKKIGDTGPVLVAIDDTTQVAKGDKVVVRLVITSDRNLEYVHLKDMRAAAFEPASQLSGYRYQDGLGYYEAPGDASTNFFISYLAIGNYVFEYEMLATIAGDFTNGITTLQCMYAPEFTTHSEGIRIQVQ